MESAPLDHSTDFDPGLGLEPLLKSAPARWVVYLFADEADRPVQLLCVRNLRASLRRRLGDERMEEPSRRIDYRKVVRRVYWSRVDSEFEADLLYLRTARRLFPQSYQKLVSARPAWFVHVDPEAKFPRYQKTKDLTQPAGELFGPIEDKTSAGKLIEQITDWFDLCRYYNVLTESPGGKPCAYKEMGKCPAPCDGSVSLEQYRRLIEWSVQTLRDPADFIRTHERRMKQAADAMNFEAAGRIKAYVQSLSVLGKGAYRHACRLRDCRFVTVQRGPRAGDAKVFLILPSRIEMISGLRAAPQGASGVISQALHCAEAAGQEAVSQSAAEEFGVVAHHLFKAKPSGVFMPLERADERSLAAAYREVSRQQVSDVADEEGVVQELQSSPQV